MEQNFTDSPDMMCRFDAITTGLLVTDTGGLLLTTIAIACVFLKSMEGTLRAILLSYLSSNIASCSVLVYGILSCIGENNAEKVLHMSVNISTVVSLSHILLLLLHYYILLTSNTRKNVIDIIGLLFAAWITSATIGTLKVSAP